MNTPEKTPFLDKATFTADTFLKEMREGSALAQYGVVLGALLFFSYIVQSSTEGNFATIFVLVLVAYMLGVLAKIAYRSFDKKLKMATVQAQAVQVLAEKNKEQQQAMEVLRLQVLDFQQANKEFDLVYRKLEEELTKEKDKYKAIRASYDSLQLSLTQAQASLTKYEGMDEQLEAQLKKVQTNAYVQAVKEFDELVTLKRSIPQLKDDEKKEYATKRHDELDKRIEKAKMMAKEKMG